MNANCYDFVVSRDCLNFRFWSEGPKGRIEKGIYFTRDLVISTLFNLGFGDIDIDGNIDDLVTSNNYDAEKVLVTVAKAVVLFTNRYPDALIYVIGSTASRTRRYQMGINKFWSEIQGMFDIYGITSDGNIESFRSGINYKSFVGKRKRTKFVL